MTGRPFRSARLSVSLGLLLSVKSGAFVPGDRIMGDLLSLPLGAGLLQQPRRFGRRTSGPVGIGTCLAREQQRRSSRAVFRVDVGTTLDQELHEIGAALPGGHMEGRALLCDVEVAITCVARVHRDA